MADSLLRFDRDTLLRSMRGEYPGPVSPIHFDSDDGLMPDTTRKMNGSLHLAQDGCIWVATSAGACVLDPEIWEQERQGRVPPLISISTTLVDDEAATDALASGEITLKPTDRRLEIDGGS